MAAETLIACNGLVKIYKIADLEVVALQGLDLVVQRGEMLGIVGASGSGKSTLMNILGGLDHPSAGQVRVDGVDLLKMSSGEATQYRQEKIGFVWQQGSRNLVHYLTAIENVKVPMMISASQSRNETSRATELLESVGLKDRLNHRLMELSGGEQQRVAIAVALANNPSLLLADEPTGELDSITATEIFRLIRDINKKYNITTIIVSHDSNIARWVDRVVAIRDGKTSSETVRQSTVSSAAPGELVHGEAAKDELFEEITLLDSAGRLQVPRDFLDRLDIKGRVRLELLDDGILIRPVEGASREHASQHNTAGASDQDAIHHRKGWFRRLLKNRNNPKDRRHHS
jgi:putative ABC transport system ATP-binding protein